MKDKFGREIDYLRVSVTDNCNLRCIYCMSEKENNFLKKNEKLTDDEIYINGDYDRLKQVFINLIKNGIESFDGKKGKLEINTKENNKEVIISIIDNGCGMDEDILKNINEMFYTTKKNGTGIGLPLSNEIIKLHNGKLNFYSKK